MCLSIRSLDTIECVYEIILNMKYQRRHTNAFFNDDCVAFLPFYFNGNKRETGKREERGG